MGTQGIAFRVSFRAEDHRSETLVDEPFIGDQRSDTTLMHLVLIRKPSQCDVDEPVAESKTIAVRG